MPVTAKLSRHLYERFGDEITNELVDWLPNPPPSAAGSASPSSRMRAQARFNSVDATYQSSLRELNEINFARFDAKLEQRIAGVETRLEARIDVLERQVREEIATRIASSESRMIRWMVTLWSGSILTTAGLIIAVLRTR